MTCDACSSSCVYVHRGRRRRRRGPRARARGLHRRVRAMPPKAKDGGARRRSSLSRLRQGEEAEEEEEQEEEKNAPEPEPEVLLQWLLLAGGLDGPTALDSTEVWEPLGGRAAIWRRRLVAQLAEHGGHGGRTVGPPNSSGPPVARHHLCV